MAHQELVVNLSARERTRQEILWEVVASEERCVVDPRKVSRSLSPNPAADTSRVLDQLRD